MAMSVCAQQIRAISQCGVAGGLTNMGVSGAGTGIGLGVSCPWQYSMGLSH